MRGCSPVPKTETRACSPKPLFYGTALLFPLDPKEVSERKKKNIKNKNINKFSRDCPLIFWGFCLCVFSPPIRNDPKKHKQLFGTHPVPGQFRKFVYVYVFFSFPKNSGKETFFQGITSTHRAFAKMNI